MRINKNLIKNGLRLCQKCKKILTEQAPCQYYCKKCWSIKRNEKELNKNII